MANPKQLGFFDGNHPKQANISIKPNHELVRISDTMPWENLTEIAMNCRASKVKALVGPEPHYRELLGSVVLMAVRQITYRQAEDLIAHYAPARFPQSRASCANPETENIVWISCFFAN